MYLYLRRLTQDAAALWLPITSMMEQTNYPYFRRDVSWLSFNYRVLMEAADASLPIYERLRFLAIYASNLEEFYEIRVAEHRSVVMGRTTTDESPERAAEVLEAITAEVNRQQLDFYHIFYNGIQPELARQGVVISCSHRPEPFHEAFVQRYFDDEVFPFLAPVPVHTGIRTFIRDKRLYLTVQLRNRTDNAPHCLLIKIPHAKTPRFVPLPPHDGIHRYMFIDDVIRANLDRIFPGYIVEGCYSFKISRDADIYLDDTDARDMPRSIRRKVEQRKTGPLSRFMYDRDMPPQLLTLLCDCFQIRPNDLVAGGRHMNLQDLHQLPNPVGPTLERHAPTPMRVPRLDAAPTIFDAVANADVLLYFPYHSFDYLLRFLAEAATDTAVDEIKITQYRVAENSAVIDSLIAAARNGKQVTVFVELKARFDEKNNLFTAERMERAGIRIIYSLPGLKVHAKIALIRRNTAHHPAVAYFSTGNFNEKTARVYADMALLTCRPGPIADAAQLFDMLEGKRTTEPDFRHLLVSRFNMLPELIRLIRREADHARNGRFGRLVLKMNGLHDSRIIDELYRASEAGVKIDLIVRGICCLVPDQPCSRMIRITRLVDEFLEHARIWYFHNNGQPAVYLSSADWMNRNLNRRVETACPIDDPQLQWQILEILSLQLRDNVKACTLDASLRNHYKRTPAPPLRAQQAIREYLAEQQQRN